MRLLSLFGFVLVSFLNVAVAKEPISEMVSHDGNLMTIEALIQFNASLNVLDSWVVDNAVNQVTIIDGKDLVNVETGTMTDRVLTKGIWYNPNNSSVFLKIGRNKRPFELPSESTLAFGRVAGDFPERAVRISGASRDDIEFLDILEFGDVAIRNEADWIEAISETVSGKVFDDILADGATFGPKGVTSVNVGLLKEQLNYEHLEYLLNALGLGMRYAGKMADGWDNMWCASVHSCQEKARWVCTSNC